MSGRPVWLCSMSLRRAKSGSVVCTADWRDRFDYGHKRMAYVLGALGDSSRERLFRMNVTLCLHRAAEDAEIAALPAGWCDTAGALAGGPVELIWSKGVAESESCQPCRRPGREPTNPNRPDLWIPIDCGECPPCLARAAIISR